MAATAVTLNDLEGYSQVAGLFKCNPSNFVQHFTGFQLTLCSRSFCVGWASCMNRETTDKRMLETQKVDNNKMRKVLFVSLCPLDM